MSGISDFHKHFYKSYVGKPVGDLDKEGPVNAQELERALQVGALFAEHGMAAIRTCSKSGREGPLKIRRAARCAFCRSPAPGLFTKKQERIQGVWKRHSRPFH